MSALQLFTEEVVADLLGVEPPMITAAVQRFESGEMQAGEEIVGIDIIAIIALIEMLMPLIMDLIDNCPANQARVRESIQSPRLMQRVRFRRMVNRAVRQGAPRWRNESYEVAKIMLDRAASSDDATVDAVIDECRANQTGGWE